MDTTARFERAVRSFAGCCLTGLGYVVMVHGLGFEPSVLALRGRTIPDVSLPCEILWAVRLELTISCFRRTQDAQLPYAHMMRIGGLLEN